jgi:hypothetical protein
MSGASAADGRRPHGWGRLPERLRPREGDRSEIGQRGRGDLRRVESTLLVLALLVLTAATVNDVARQIKVNDRLTADLRTWRTFTGHDYRNISIEQDLKGHSTREVLCGNTSPGAPGALPQVCLIVTGPVVGGRRAVHGGFYLPPYLPDLRPDRYACFGTAVDAGLCGLPTPPGAPHAPLTGG